MEAAPTPTQIHRYRIVAEIGRGSMGRVFLAEDPNIDRRIALKVLDLARAGDEEAAERRRHRFLREARAAGRLSHPGVVMVLDADTDPDTGSPYIAMEWVDGETLQQILVREGPLPPGVAVGLATRVAEALAYAHRHEVVHRDVKPGNILVSREGTVKLSDFGIAKIATGSITGPGTIIGSPFYMSPEQVRGDDADPRSDVFSLGAVLYECLTGRPPFGGQNLAAITYQILQVDPRPADFYCAGLSPLLLGVLTRALAKDPADRFQSAEALAQALRDARASGLDLATASPPPDPFPEPPVAAASSSRPGEDTAGRAAGVVPPTAEPISARRYMKGIGSESLVTRHRPRRRRRGRGLLLLLLGLATVALLGALGLLLL